MKSANTGTGTSEAEILNVSPRGIWLLVRDREFFLDLDEFPWFRRATCEQVFNVQLLHAEHLYWPDLDIDLDIDRIAHPERYPLIAQVQARR